MLFYHSFHSIIDVSFGLQQNNIHYTLANYSSNVMHFICYSFIFYFTYFPTELRNAASDVASSSCLHNIKIQQKHFTDLIIIVYKTCMPQHTQKILLKIFLCCANSFKICLFIVNLFLMHEFRLHQIQ